MASLIDLFNPTFLMFLGILVLVVALLVVYFESKMREQNHTIASMLSLVSTLAEDMNGVKMGLNHLAIKRGSNFHQQQNLTSEENLGNNLSLIEVSDDEVDDVDEDDVDEDDVDVDEDEEKYEIGNETTSETDNSPQDTKVIKLQLSNEIIDEETNNLEFEPEEDLSDFELDDDNVDVKVENDYVENVLDLKYEDLKDNIQEETKVDTLEEFIIPQSSELKTISINLGDEYKQYEENIDYKKLQLSKLKSIAIEKGLLSNLDVSKLKKNDILKLLGAE